MSRSNGSADGGSGQRTVAELLAMYGEAAPATTGRRRRRRDEDEPEPTTVNGNTRVVPEPDQDFGTPAPPPPPRRRTRSHAADPPTPPELRYDPLGVDALLGLGTGPKPGPVVDDDDRPTQADLPVVSDDLTLTQPHRFGQLTPAAETDQLPTVSPGVHRGPVDPGPPTASMPVETEDTDLEDIEDLDDFGTMEELSPAGRESVDFGLPMSKPRAARRRSQRYDEDDLDLEPTSEREFDLDADDDWDEEIDGPRPTPSPLREWAVVAGQVGVGVVGGAALWLICEWLWQSLPVVALVVALGVITGLVWVVRKVRRAEDMQTTLVAVLVGLFVTVSPAALLLVDK